jgi:hypothetical protein
MKSNLNFLIAAFVLVAGGCSKDDNDSATNSTGGTGASTINIDSPWQYSAKIDGTSYSKIIGTTVGGAYSTSSQTAIPPDSSNAAYGSTLMDASLTDLYFDMTRNGHHFLGSSAENTEFLDFFTAGNYNYTTEEINGVSISWRDETTGTIWTTYNGSADQTGSAFVIEQVKVLSSQFEYTIKVLAHFNCKLYDGSGNSKTVTEGKFVGQFSND